MEDPQEMELSFFAPSPSCSKSPLSTWIPSSSHLIAQSKNLWLCYMADTRHYSTTQLYLPHLFSWMASHPIHLSGNCWMLDFCCGEEISTFCLCIDYWVLNQIKNINIVYIREVDKWTIIGWPKGVAMNQEKVMAVIEWPTPRTIKGVLKIPGFCQLR